MLIKVTKQGNEMVCLHSMAEQGDSRAQFKLGLCYANGHGVRKDYAEAMKWCRKAAEQGVTAAQVFVPGNDFVFGWEIQQVYASVVNQYRRAAEQGEEEAQFNLGCCYEQGQGVSQNYSESVKW